MAEPLALTPGQVIRRGAVISPCGRYRYCLTRQWGPGSKALWIMLNPSTADADVDDPTIRRLIGFARSWGHDGFAVVNLFAFRATKPPRHWQPQHIGPENDFWISECVAQHALVVCAWGANGTAKRARFVLDLIRASDVTPMTLALTLEGAPRHPLYLAGALRPRSLDELLGEVPDG